MLSTLKFPNDPGKDGFREFAKYTFLLLMNSCRYKTKTGMGGCSFSTTQVSSTNPCYRQFYTNFFEASPVSRTLFEEDLEEQAQALIRMIRFIVNNLDDSSIIESTLMVLGNNLGDFPRAKTYF